MKMLTLLIALIFSFSLFANCMENCPCKSEVQKFCADAKDHAEHKACLEKHKNELSKECQDQLSNCTGECGKDCQKKCPKHEKKKNCKKQCPLKKKE